MNFFLFSLDVFIASSFFFNNSSCGHPSFSPDSKKIAYGYIENKEQKINIADIKTGELLESHNVINFSTAKYIIWTDDNIIYYQYTNHRNWGVLNLSNGKINNLFSEASLNRYSKDAFYKQLSYTWSCIFI